MSSKEQPPCQCYNCVPTGCKGCKGTSPACAKSKAAYSIIQQQIKNAEKKQKCQCKGCNPKTGTDQICRWSRRLSAILLKHPSIMRE